MQGNEIGSDFGKRYVVLLEDLLYKRPKPRTVKSLFKPLRTIASVASDWTINDNMLVWINSFSRRFSISAEIWSFLEDEELYEQLILPVLHVCDDYVAEMKRWESLHEAYVYLRASPEIQTVYDASEDRCARYWHFRGTYIPEGATP